MSNAKITKREVINLMLADENIAGNDVFVSYLENELSLLDKRKNRKGDEKKAQENADLMGVLVDILKENEEPMTCTEIANADSRFSSNQKVSALVTKLVAEGKVIKNTDGKSTLISLA